MSIATKLVEHRKNLNLSRKEVAEKLGIAPQTLGHYETGYSQPSEKIISKICEIYGIKQWQLYVNSEDEILPQDSAAILLKKTIKFLKEQNLVEPGKKFNEFNEDARNIIIAVFNKYLDETE